MCVVCSEKSVPRFFRRKGKIVSDDDASAMNRRRVVVVSRRVRVHRGEKERRSRRRRRTRTKTRTRTKVSGVERTPGRASNLSYMHKCTITDGGGGRETS